MPNRTADPTTPAEPGVSISPGHAMGPRFWLANAVISISAVALIAWLLLGRQSASTDQTSLAFMPLVNACLNGLSTGFLLLGFVAIRNRQIKLHRGLMLGALLTSALFLGGYLTYHYVHGDTRFPADHPWRIAYLALLASHVVLSIVTFPLIVTVVWNAYRQSFAWHRKFARVTFPLWLYVSVTGVLVYLMLRSA